MNMYNFDFERKSIFNISDVTNDLG